MSLAGLLTLVPHHQSAVSCCCNTSVLAAGARSSVRDQDICTAKHLTCSSQQLAVSLQRLKGLGIRPKP